jgi:threonine/homoserine/homoserine lactone efflux protein
MMDLNLYIAFFVATTIMILLPGPSVMLTVAHSISFGWRRALATVAGATIGVGVQLAITLVGMTSLLVLMAAWFEWLRWAGVAYLAYLGVQQWRARPETGSGSETEAAATVARPARSLLIQGVVVTTANPKSMFFLAAFFPQFVDPLAAPGPQFALLGVTFLAITFGFTGLWAVAAGHASKAFRTRRGILLRNRIAGTLMLGAGLGLALARRA